jgi:hypothetical protein
MWKVHLPATSHIKKQTFFGTNDFLRVFNNTIRKSAGLMFNNQLRHSWNPSDAGVNPDPKQHDHPPFNHHPETGELLDGGLHPIDYVHRDLMQRIFPKALASGDADKLREAQVQTAGLIQEAIDQYNANHDTVHGDGKTNHSLPNFSSSAWRKVHAGPHYENNVPTHMRRVRGAEPLYENGPRPLITYSMNRGNVKGGATGRWIDSGFIHMNKELGDVLKKRTYLDDKDISQLHYVKYNRLMPGSLSGGIVQSIAPRDFKTYQQTGQLPDMYLSGEQQQSLAENRRHPEVHGHQLAHFLPHSAFRRMGAGGRGQGAGFNGEKLQAFFDEQGIDHGLSPEELNDVSRSAMIRLLFQNKSHGINSDGTGRGVGAVFRNIVRGLGSHHNEDTYKLHAQHASGAAVGDTQFARSANHRAGEIVAHISHTASKLMNEGVPQDEALQTVLGQLRAEEEDANIDSHGVDEEYRDKVQGVIDKLLEKTGHERFTFGEIPTDYEKDNLEHSVPDFGHHQAPDHWQDRIYTQQQLAPPGATVRGELNDMAGSQGMVGEGTVQPAPAIEQRPQQVRVVPGDMAGIPQPTGQMPAIPALPTRQASPEEMAFQQARALPRGQTFFNIAPSDDVTGLVQQAPIRTSGDVVNDIDLIRKKMGYFDGFLRGEF